VTESWWLKLGRADDHLKNIDKKLTAMSNPSPRRVRVEKHVRNGEWIYSIHHDLAVPEILPVIIGEFLFDVRSALDHIMAACVTPGAEDKSQFPIFTQDIWRQGSSAQEIKRLESSQATWNRYTQGAKPAVIAFLKKAQPYQNAAQNTGAPEDHSLAILNEFQNADKHRQLGIISNGLSGVNAVAIESDGTKHDLGSPAVGTYGMFPDGARILTTATEVDVEITGTVEIAMRSGPNGGYREISDTLDAILETSWECLTEIGKAM
jgi:hypothetical protein